MAALSLKLTRVHRTPIVQFFKVYDVYLSTHKEFYMIATRNTARAAAVFYFITWVTSIVGLTMYGSILDPAIYSFDSISKSHIATGAFLEILAALANIATGLALYPIVKRQSENFALGYVVLRTLEAGIMIIGTLPLLALLTLNRDIPKNDATAGIQSAFIAMHNFSFILGPSITCGVNTMVLAFVLHRSGLVARFIPLLGMTGGAIVFVSGTLQMFGVVNQVSVASALMALPVFSWEISLASFLFFKGFKESALNRLHIS